MRISDWSSDVCSSDLTAGSTPAGADRLRKRIRQHRRERQPEGSPTMASGKSEKVATLYRMVMSDHLCPYGLKSKDLLERQGFTVKDHHLKHREETDAFKKKHGVDRAEEHTHELQSLMRISYAVFCLKKKIKQTTET